MDEEKYNDDSQPEDHQPEDHQSDDVQNIDDLPNWAQTMIKSLRDESASRRIALKQQQQAQREAEQRRLADEGKWRELAEEREAELKSLQPYRQRAEALESKITASNKRRIESIPEGYRTLVPINYTADELSDWLDANLQQLIKPTAPKLDGGVSGKIASIDLTEDEKAIARSTGLTFEEYAEYKNRSYGNE